MESQTQIWTLSSGSSGNCCWVRHGETEFLIDAGISMRAIKKTLAELGSSPERLAAIFVTHEHSDHVKGLAMMAKYYHIPIHAAGRTAMLLGDTDGDCIHPHTPLYEVTLSEDVKVSSFLTPHDSMTSVGYTFELSGRRFALATDMGMCAQTVADALVGCEGVILEANYDEEMLKNGPYPLYLQERISGRSGHLCNRDSARMAAYLALNGTHRFLLAHLSAENNTPDLALNTVRGYLSEHHIEAEVAVADRYAPTRLV